MKGISVITNFGCPFDCPYCIWKGHPLEHCHDETDWGKLDAFLRKGAERGCDHVSISGGGEPLFRFREHMTWWNRLMESAKAARLYVDIHTRMRPTYSDDAWDFIHSRIHRLVMSSDRVEDVMPYADSDECPAPYRRVVHVVTEHDTMGTLRAYARACRTPFVQFSFKKLHGSEDNDLWEQARRSLSIPNICFIKDCDFNEYYMPNNMITGKFMLEEDEE